MEFTWLMEVAGSYDYTVVPTVFSWLTEVKGSYI